MPKTHLFTFLLYLFCISISFAQSEKLEKDLREILSQELKFDEKTSQIEALLPKYEKNDKVILYQILGQFFEEVDSIKSVKNYREALKIEPQNPKTLYQLGNYLTLISDSTKQTNAVFYLEKAETEVVKIQPADKILQAYILDALGWSYYQTKKYFQAEQKLKTSIEIFDSIGLPNTLPTSHILETYAAQNKYELAFDLLLKIYVASKGSVKQIEEDLQVAYKGFNNGSLQGFDEKIKKSLKDAEASYSLEITKKGGKVVTFQTKDYHKIEGIFYQPSVTNAPVVILVTPFGLTQEKFGSLTQKFLKENIAVLTFDLRSHGRSTNKDFSTPSVLKKKANAQDFQNIPFDVEAALDFLQTQKGVNAKKTGVVGVDEGCTIARIGARFSEEVSAFVLVSPLDTFRFSDVRKAVKSYPKKTLFVGNETDTQSLETIEELFKISDTKITEKKVFSCKDIGIVLLNKNPEVESFIVNWLKTSFQ
ncbi:dienelactone hydrolase family protein [bacterium]|nr:dienelactone hydrolase family protein [bacterium]